MNRQQMLDAIDAWQKAAPEIRDFVATANPAGGLPPEPLPVPRRVLAGYFGDNPSIVDETKDHANLTMATGWPVGDTYMKVALDAHKAGNKIVLMCTGEHMEWATWGWDRLQEQGVLKSVVAIYPCDEPDKQGYDEARVGAMCSNVRATLSRYPEIANAPLGVFYGGAGTPGIQFFDIVGADVYNKGPQTLPLRAGQMLWTIASGSFGESPDAYVAHAQTHPEVFAVLGFMWRQPNPSAKHIATNGMADAYRTAFRKLTGRTAGGVTLPPGEEAL